MPVKISIAIAIIALVGSLLISKKNKEQHIVDLGPIALEVFDSCINSARLSKPITEIELAEKAASILKQTSKPAQMNHVTSLHTLELEVEDDFDCFVAVPHQSYNPKILRQQLDVLKTSSFDGRVKNCFWKNGKSGKLTSILSCTLSSNTAHRNLFRLNIGLIASEGVYFWVQPSLIFEADGKVRLVK